MKIVYILVILALSASQLNADCLKNCCQTLTRRAAMTYIYYQKSGHFIGGTGNWAIDTYAYSGQGQGYNNPDYQCVSNTGPLPATTYKLSYCKDTMHDPPVTRPCSFYLDPQIPKEMCGRSEMFIHGCQCCTNGDNTTPPIGGCSAGCVVVNHFQREKLRVGDTLIVKHVENNLCQYFKDHDLSWKCHLLASK